MRELIHTVRKEDVGKTAIYGVPGHPTCFSPLGRVMACDVGKRIYKVDGVYQVENREQLEARLAREQSFAALHPEPSEEKSERIMVDWTRPKLDRLKKAYAEAVASGAGQFTMKDGEKELPLVVDYAKYLIEYLESVL
jgi:hypothetical protein